MIRYEKNIPENWQLKRLKDVGVDGLTNGIFKTKDQFGFGVKLVNVTDLYSGNSVIDNEKLDRVSAEPNEIKRFCVKNGDIFFVRSSLKLEGIGVSAIFEKREEETVFECHIIRFRPNQKQILPKFAIYQLNSNEITHIERGT
jgi:type I restriction enzyme S subunit